MTRHAKEIGILGETIAKNYLKAHGYEIIEQNFRTRYGEIDIIAFQNSGEDKQEEPLVFVEVKTRTGNQFGYPEQSITSTKVEHILAAITEYLQKENKLDEAWQVDVISIEINDKQKPIVTHYENVTPFTKFT